MACASSLAARLRAAGDWVAPLTRTGGAAALLLGLSSGYVAPMAAAAGTLGAEVSSVELRARVQVAAGPVRLGDVANITSRSLATLRTLIALPIGQAPRPGSMAVLDRASLERWVAAKGVTPWEPDALPAGGPAIRWTGAPEVSIDSAAQELAGDTVSQAARASLLAWLSRRSVRADVQVISASHDLTLPAGTATLRVRSLPEDALPSRRMQVWVEVWVDGRFARSTVVSFEVQAWAPMVVATDELQAGTPLDALTLRASTTTREVNLTSLPPTSAKGAATALSARNAAINAKATVPAMARGSMADSSQYAQAPRNAPPQLRRTLKAGDVLTDASVEPAAAVVRGNWARMQTHSGDVLIENRVEVLQDGRAGQLVRVRVPSSREEVIARVTGPGELELRQ